MPELEAGRRLAALDGLRALSVLAVLFCHTRIAPGGYVGVDVFFVISGFIITTLLLKENERGGRIDLLAFYWRRAVRLMPALVVVLAVFAGYDAARHHSLDTASIRAVPAVLFYVGNWVQAAHGVDSLGLWGHAWSLSVEEQFYLAWPLVLICTLPFGRRAVGWTATMLFLVSAGWGLWVAHHAGFARMRGTDVTVGEILIGCALAVAAAEAPVKVVALGRTLWLPAGVYLVAFAIIDPATHSPYGPELNLLGVLCATALVARFTTASSSFLSSAPLAGLGRISYGFYLWHLPIILAVEGHLPKNDWLLTGVTLPLSLFAAVLSWNLVERPFQRLRGLVGQRGQRLSGRGAGEVARSGQVA